MIPRLFYLVAGAALGGYVVHKLNRTAQAWSPAGIADRVEDHVADYRAALREFNEDVQAAMERREAELRRQYGAGPTTPAGRASQPRGAIGAPDQKDGR
ncbi:DUF6167 family protein [Streptomonospora nanhaiensis]|uniref:Secreted protein n=1 Tax=Streptomonospora nanhaiensis TaxID=1323731 RepID=A0A853BVQ1_9ACTN|nr:DUF6167 family protein [Streptomonospora nanhaiensis]MBV2364881.1 hypothetical protein [Streptomonospora nanhaiensis]MBX9387152.1 hypothetical protein [Streptomonospora nanhaiensis]NYI98825.1 hypothetical protein [Streptomonospora nanhaiensis]